MFEIRIHGRGGQGVVTAAELLSISAFDEGRHAQAFPSFGSERTGAPVAAFCRIDDRPIRTREPVSRFGCDNCYGVCPDNAVIKLAPGGAWAYAIDLDFCKGCGLCAEECPCGAIEMVEEQI